jgi:FkbM family methyltransferase
MLGLGKVKNQLRTAIASHRRSSVVVAIHGVTSFVESAWRNEGSDFASNGERFVLQRLRAANFRMAIDGGAHLGDWFCEALDLWPSCYAHAFEVAPPIYDQLKVRILSYAHKDRVSLHELGLSDEAGVQTMYYFPDCPQLTCDIPRHGSYKSVPFQANLITLDRFCNEHQIDTVDFLKIDVEGAEHRVLKGFHQHLASGKVSCIQLEYGAFSIQTRFLLKDYYDLLSDQYWIGKIFPNYVGFGDYDWTTEDFRFSNYLCVSKRRPELRDLVQS